MTHEALSVASCQRSVASVGQRAEAFKTQPLDAPPPMLLVDGMRIKIASPSGKMTVDSMFQSEAGCEAAWYLLTTRESAKQQAALGLRLLDGDGAGRRRGGEHCGRWEGLRLGAGETRQQSHTDSSPRVGARLDASACRRRTAPRTVSVPSF